MRFAFFAILLLTFIMPVQVFAFEDAAPVSNVGYKEGKISRYQRTPYVPGGMDTSKFSAWGKAFDAQMDELEGLMADKIRENNEIAAQQQAIPGYSF